MAEIIRPKFTVIRDTREKEGWTFPESTTIAETIERKLDTGDYSILGMEDVLCIERKMWVAELAGNIVQVRFTRELERMQSFRFRYIICEFPMSKITNFPEGSNIPFSSLRKMSMTSQFFMRRISQIQVNYGINVIFAGSAADGKYAAGNIMKRVYEVVYDEREKQRLKDSATS